MLELAKHGVFQHAAGEESAAFEILPAVVLTTLNPSMLPEG